MSHERLRSALVIAAFVGSAGLVAFLPGHLPPAFGIPRGIDVWVSRLVSAFFLPLVALICCALLRRLAASDPARANYRRFEGTFDLVLDVVVILVLGLHATLLATLLLGAQWWLGRIPPLLIGLAFVAIGNALPRVRPNAVVGIPTSWARRSERAWAVAHRAGGYVLVFAGLVIIVSTFSLRSGLGWLVGAGAAVTVFALAVISWLASGKVDAECHDTTSNGAPSSSRSSSPRS